ncbi:MAG: pentapeptide repeat-containing protein [Desulfobacterales bacterium]
MTNKKMVLSIGLLLAFTFISTAVFAESNWYSSERKSSSWWRIPYYHLWKTSNDLERKISTLQRKADQLENRKNQLEERVRTLKAEMDTLRQRQDTLATQSPVVDKEDVSGKAAPLICPACYFWGTNEFDGHDFSGAYLKWAYYNYAVLNGTNFSGANLKKSYFTEAKLDGVDFSGANLTDADFTNASLTNITWSAQGIETTCPDGYIVSNGGSCVDHLK